MLGGGRSFKPDATKPSRFAVVAISPQSMLRALQADVCFGLEAAVRCRAAPNQLINDRSADKAAVMYSRQLRSHGLLWPANRFQISSEQIGIGDHDEAK